MKNPPNWTINEASDWDDDEVPPEIPLREQLAPRVPDLCPDDTYSSVKIIPFLPDGAISAILVACDDAGLARPTAVRVDWNPENATVIVHVNGIAPHETSVVMAFAQDYWPVDIGIDVRVEKGSP